MGMSRIGHPNVHIVISSSSPLLMTTSISDDFVIPLVTIEVNCIVDLTRKARGCLLLPSCMVYTGRVAAF